MLYHAIMHKLNKHICGLQGKLGEILMH